MHRGPETENERTAAARRGIDRFAVVLLLSAVAYLYINLFAFPMTPFLLGGDQTYFWMDGQRMLTGDQPYRDFFQFTPPGTDLFYFLLFKFFGLHIWVTNVAVLVLGVVLTWICFEGAGEIMERKFALLAASLFLVLIYGKALNGTHHWFSVLAVMGAVRIGQRHNAAKWALTAGALLGLASFFTQTRGVVAALAFALFLLWKRSHANGTWRELSRDELLLFAGFSASLLALSARFVAIVGRRQLWYDQVTYVRRYMVHGVVSQFMGLPEPLSGASLPRLAPYLFVYLLLPVIYSVGLWRCWRDRRDPAFRWEPVTLLTLVGLSLLVEVASSLNWLRLYAVAMPGIILLIWTLGRAKKIRLYATAAVWILISALALRQIWSRQFGQYVAIDTPGGKTAVSTQTYDKLQSMMRYTKPGQFMFQAAGPGIYLPLQLHNPVFLDAVETNQQTRPEHIEQTIQQLEAKKVQFVLWPQRLDDSDQFDRSTEDTISPLRNYVRVRYTRVQVFADREELWKRK
jgi:Dolichyl-phosphate-mannose-protein mannosyltransferase